MANFPQNALEDGELTDHEIRRLIHEIVRERMRVASDLHVAKYWAALEDYWDMPHIVAPFDPSILHQLRDVLTEEVRQEVLDFMSLDLTTTKKR